MLSTATPNATPTQADIVSFADNLVLELTQGACRVRIYTTDDPEVLKMEQENSSIHMKTERITLREAKQALVNCVVHGFRITLNLLFRKGVMSVVHELAQEYRDREQAQEQTREQE